METSLMRYELPPFPRPARLLYSLSAWRQLFRAGGARIMREHLEWNLGAALPYVKQEHRVLDIGCWDGSLGQALASSTGARVEGVDIVDKNQSDIPFQRFDGRTLPYASDERFDRILLMYVLHHSAHARDLLSQARKHLSKDGMLLIAEDMVESRWQRIHTIGFHIWLFTVTLMGWKGRFRKIDEWRTLLAEEGLELRWVDELGRQGSRPWFPRNMLLVAVPSEQLEQEQGTP